MLLDAIENVSAGQAAGESAVGQTECAANQCTPERSNSGNHRPNGRAGRGTDLRSVCLTGDLPCNAACYGAGQAGAGYAVDFTLSKFFHYLYSCSKKKQKCKRMAIRFAS